MLWPQQTLPDGSVLYMFRMTADDKARLEKESGTAVRKRPVETKPPATTDAKAGPPPVAAAAADSAEPEGVIDWTSSQLDLRSPATAIGGVLNGKHTPTSIQVRYAQEDLWVVEALLRILQKTNEKATSTYNAPVKRILSLKIGVDAAQEMARSQDRIIRGADRPLWRRWLPPKPAAGGKTGDAGAGGSEEDLMARVLRNNRYVDQDCRPLGADDKPPFAEFKMMPVCMQLGLAQEAIPLVSINCANFEHAGGRPPRRHPAGGEQAAGRECPDGCRARRRGEPRFAGGDCHGGEGTDRPRVARHRSRQPRRHRGLGRGSAARRDGRRDPRDHLHLQSAAEGTGWHRSGSATGRHGGDPGWPGNPIADPAGSSPRRTGQPPTPPGASPAGPAPAGPAVPEATAPEPAPAAKTAPGPEPAGPPAGPPSKGGAPAKT